jgi:hypothetical protein
MKNNLLVPTLRVGTHVWPLCGPVREGSVPAGQHVRDAERPGVRSHAERGHEEAEQSEEIEG